MKRGKRGILWPILFAVLTANLAAFGGILILARPIWYGIDDFLEAAAGVALPWVLGIFALTVALTAYAGFLTYRSAKKYRAGQENAPGLVHKIVFFFVLVVWNGMLALLLSQMGTETGKLQFQFLELSGWILLSALLVILILVLPLSRFWKNARFRFIVFLLLPAAIVFCSIDPGKPTVAAGPYLHAPTETSVTVGWITKEPCVGWVEYGQNGKLDKKAYSMENGLIAANQTVNKIKLEGLAPGQTYEYRIVSRKIKNQFPYDVEYGQTFYGEVFRFTTLDASKSEFSFLVIADLHENVELLTRLIKTQAGQPYDFVVFNGDALDYLTSEAQMVQRFFAPVSELFASQTPFVLVRGNHETRGKLARRLTDYIDTPSGKYYGTFRHGPVEFLVLDTGEDKADDHEEYAGLVNFAAYRQEEGSWLKGAVLEESYGAAPFRVAFAHIPLNEFQTEGSESSSSGYQKEWAKALTGSGLDLMLSGHYHINRAYMPEGDVGFPVVLAGGEAFQEAGYRLLRVTVTGDAIELNYIDENGNVTDSLTVERANP
ncbi:MAG: FN3 domain-containing metallophosphoesterase family protein [Clostridiaceae bacterium]